VNSLTFSNKHPDKQLTERA